MCRFSVPPGYVRSKPPEKPKFGALIPVIDAILEADKTAPPKQRQTAKRIFERLRDEHGFSGGYTVVKDHVRLARTRNRETFVPLSHLPGHAQVDFGESVGVIGGMRMKLHVFCFDLPHSDACFVKAYPAETTEAFLDGHVSAFTFFGGVPLSILYDNLKIAVARILGDGKRTRTRSFTELLSHYLFDDRFGRPGKGNDKGKVEALVKYTRANFLTPMPHAASFAASTPHWSSVAATAKLSMSAAMRRRSLCGFTLIRQCFVICLRCPSNHARSVPRRSPPPPWYATEATTIQCRRHLVSATCWSKASSMKSSSSVAPGWSRDILVYTGVASSPSISRHYLALIERKPGALDQAAPLQGWTLPESLRHLRRLLEARMGRRGKREFIQVLRLMEAFPQTAVVAAATDAIRLGAISFDAVKQLVLAGLEQRPVRLDLTVYPYLPAPTVHTTAAADYAVPLSRRAA